MGGKQLGISDYELTTDKKQTQREVSLRDGGSGVKAGADRIDRAPLPQSEQEGRLPVSMGTHTPIALSFPRLSGSAAYSIVCS